MSKSNKTELLVAFLFLTVVGSFLLFYRLDELPLRLWDEGRRAVNALEMSRGDSPLLVPTFAGEPDHWGTKPPLLVWLQALCYQLFGAGILAVRIPAAVAALLSCWAMFGFAVRRFDAPWWGVAAGFTLLSVPVYLGSHAARSGDYDALLVLWTSALVWCFYEYFETRKPLALALASLCFALALWTKGVAAGFFLPGVALWTMLYQPHRFVWWDWRTYLALLLPVLSLGCYYVLRETQDPGFLTILWENEIGGRYGTTLEGHAKEPWFYVRLLFFRPGEQVWGVLLPVALALLWQRRTYLRLASYLIVLIVVFLLVISSAGTKLFWYTMPLYPLFALLSGGAVQCLLERLEVSIGEMRWWIPLGVLIVLFAWPLSQAVQQVIATEHSEDYRSITVYGKYLEELGDVPVYTVLLPSFNSHAVFAAALAKGNGQQVDIRYLRQPERRIHPGIPALSTFRTATEVVVCEMSTWIHMDSRYTFTESHAISPCKLLRVSGRQ